MSQHPKENKVAKSGDRPNYRTQLQTELKRRQTVNPKYSLRAFAKSLGLSTPFVSYVIKGKKNLSDESAVQVAKALGYSAAESAEFLRIVRIDQAISSDVREASSSPSGHASSEKAYTPIDLDLFQVVSDWYHSAVLLLTEFPRFKNDPEWIASELGITKAEASLAVGRLIRVGLLKRERGTLVKSDRFLATPTDRSHQAIRNFHLQMITKAKEALEHQSIEERDITGITFAISDDKMERAKDEIRKFRQRMAKLLDSSKPTSVYQLNVQLFKLSCSKKRV